jgi:hypothetical protein
MKKGAGLLNVSTPLVQGKVHELPETKYLMEMEEDWDPGLPSDRPSLMTSLPE